MFGRMRMGLMGTPMSPTYSQFDPLERFNNSGGPDPLGDIGAINYSINQMPNPGPGMSRIAHGRGKLGPSSYI